MLARNSRSHGYSKEGIRDPKVLAYLRLQGIPLNDLLVKTDSKKQITGIILLGNNIINFDTSLFPKLIDLDLGFNPVKNVDVSSSEDLQTLVIQNSYLSRLDLSNNKKIVKLTIVQSGGKIKVEVTKYVDLVSQVLRKIDIPTGFLQVFPNIKHLDLAGCILERYVISTHTNLNQLTLRNSSIEKLVIEDHENLELLDVRDMDLTELKIEKCSNLRRLDLSHGKIRSLIISQCLNLKEIHAAFSGLSNFEFDELPKLQIIDLTKTQVDHLDFSLFPNLMYDRLKI